MIVGAASGWSQSTFNTRTGNPAYRTLFNMACLVLTTQAAGQVYERLGGTPDPRSVDGAGAAGRHGAHLLRGQHGADCDRHCVDDRARMPWRVWRTEFASSAPSYVLGAGAAAVVIEVTNRSGYWLTLLLVLVPLYLTYKVYRAGIESEARQGAILEAAHDAIITMDQALEHPGVQPGGRADVRLLAHRTCSAAASICWCRPKTARPSSPRSCSYKSTGEGPLAGRQQIELTGLKADGTEFPIELTVARLGSDQRAVVTGFVRDITERRALEEQLRQSQKLEAIGRLAAASRTISTTS